jgi:hypothetical protein
LIVKFNNFISTGEFHQAMSTQNVGDGRVNYNKIASVSIDSANIIDISTSNNVHPNKESYNENMFQLNSNNDLLDNLLGNVKDSLLDNYNHDDLLDSLLDDNGNDDLLDDLLNNVDMDNNDNDNNDNLLDGLLHNNDNNDELLDNLLHNIEDLQLGNVCQDLDISAENNNNIEEEVEEGDVTTLSHLKPYTGEKVEEISSHLNIMNRRGKYAQRDCQKIFLCLYFQHNIERHDAVVYSVFANGIYLYILILYFIFNLCFNFVIFLLIWIGFLVYIPAYDYKGPVYLQNKDGLVTLDPSIVQLSRKSDKLSSSGDIIDLDSNIYTSNIKGLVKYKCLLQGIDSSDNYGINGGLKLFVCPIDFIPGSQTKSNNNNVIELNSMSKVRVEIKCIKKDDFHLPELQVTLISVAHKISNKSFNNNSNIINNVFNKSTNNIENTMNKLISNVLNENSLSKVGKSTISNNKNKGVKDKNTIYKLCQKYSKKKIINTTIISDIVENNANNNIRKTKKIDNIKHCIGGRISYGCDISSTSTAGSVSTNNYNNNNYNNKNNNYNNNNNKDFREKTMNTGHNAAYQKFLDWNEEWFEEEQLPSKLILQLIIISFLFNNIILIIYIIYYLMF